MFAAKGQSIILTRKNSHILFDTSFKRCYGLHYSNFKFTIKKNLEVEKKMKKTIFKKKIIFGR